MVDSASISIAILAGGQGRRLGGIDKGLHALHGSPLIAHVVAAVGAMAAPDNVPGGRDVLILANRNIDTYSSYARTLPDAVDSGEGPMAGIVTTFLETTTPWILTLPVDCPCPPADLWRRLHAAIGDADCAVAHDGSQRQPLFALYRHGLARSALKAAQAGLGPHAWQDQIHTIQVDFEDKREKFANLNSEVAFSAYAGIANE